MRLSAALPEFCPFAGADGDVIERKWHASASPVEVDVSEVTRFFHWPDKPLG